MPRVQEMRRDTMGYLAVSAELEYGSKSVLQKPTFLSKQLENILVNCMLHKVV